MHNIGRRTETTMCDHCIPKYRQSEKAKLVLKSPFSLCHMLTEHTVIKCVQDGRKQAALQRNQQHFFTQQVKLWLERESEGWSYAGPSFPLQHCARFYFFIFLFSKNHVRPCRMKHIWTNGTLIGLTSSSDLFDWCKSVSRHKRSAYIQLISQ